jgi:thiol:disulfide interchange protein
MGQDIHIAFAIAPDCHLYRDRIRLEGPNKEPIAMTLPPGELHDDAVLGGTFEIYRGQVEWTVPVADDLASVKLIYQGCAEQAGICYAAQRRVFTLK